MTGTPNSNVVTISPIKENGENSPKSINLCMYKGFFYFQQLY